MSIEEILDFIYPLPLESKEKIKPYFSEISLPKGTCLMEENKIVPCMYFIRKGIVRAYTSSENQDITFWFGTEGEPVVSMKSYVASQPGYESIELLEDCDLYMLETQKLHDLYSKDIHIANWGRKFAEKELVKTEELLISKNYKTASERYLELLTHKPFLLQRVQLGYIASYLGITQVSLSRIRAEIK